MTDSNLVLAKPGGRADPAGVNTDFRSARVSERVLLCRIFRATRSLTVAALHGLPAHHPKLCASAGRGSRITIRSTTRSLTVAALRTLSFSLLCLYNLDFNSALRSWPRR